MIVCQQEKLADVLPELTALMPLHWHNNGDPDLPCEPNWDFYAAIEKTGFATLVVARDEGRMIGYAAAFVHKHMNSRGVLVASIPTWFVEDRQGRGFILKRLLEATRDWCKAQGVRRVKIITDADKPADGLLRIMGFQVGAIEYVMKIDPLAANFGEMANA